MPWATVSENVYLPLRLKGISKKEAAIEIEKVLIQVGLKDFYNSYPRELSGGMKMRVSIARALIMKPKLLLMDEHSLGLAPQIVEALFTRFITINKEHGTTMLIVEQNAQLALDIASRAYVLESGEITIEGKASELADDDAIRRAYLGA